MIRVIDFFFSFVMLIILFPIFLIIGAIICFESRGGIFYLQERIGYKGKPFKLFKFRSMVCNADKSGLLTIGMKDNRITKSGFFIRRYKLDELPQLFNVVKGDMSIVGPRPEVKKYVDLYTPDQAKVLSIKPGITDYASIEFSNENELLSKSESPEKLYIEVILPKKIELNKKYLDDYTIFNYIKIIFLTVFKVFR